MERYKAHTREPRNLLNMKVGIVSIITGILRDVSKSLESRLDKLEIRGRFQIIHKTAFAGVCKESEYDPGD